MHEGKFSSELVAITCFAGSWDTGYQKEIAFEGWMFIHDDNNVSEHECGSTVVSRRLHVLTLGRDSERYRDVLPMAMVRYRV